VQSWVRAVTLLNRVAEGPGDGCTLTVLAQQVGLPASTAHRLLTTLEQERYLGFDQERRLWSIGVQAFMTGAAFTKSRRLGALSRPHMRFLMESSGETVNLAVKDNGEAVYLAQVECQQTMSDRAFLRILQQRGMPRLAPKTITIPAALRVEIEVARAAGCAADDEEHAVGLRCVAAPIFDETGEAVAAIPASGPTARIVDERVAPLGALILETARRISSEMGTWPKISKLLRKGFDQERNVTLVGRT
jgi:IclR family acetate operon transcriptional repressor